MPVHTPESVDGKCINDLAREVTSSKRIISRIVYECMSGFSLPKPFWRMTRADWNELTAITWNRGVESLGYTEIYEC